MKWNLYLKPLGIIAGILILISACEKDNPEPILPYQEVFNTWNWFSTTTGWGGTTWADSVSYNQELEITSQGHYTWKRADTLFRETDFIIEVDTVEGHEMYLFQFDDSSMVDQSFYVKENDTLVLSDQCADCATHIFIKK